MPLLNTASLRSSHGNWKNHLPVTFFVIVLFFLLIAACESIQKGDKARIVLERPGLACHLNDQESFLLDAPHEWILDGKSGLGQKFCIVGYPQGADWENSVAVFYTNKLSKSLANRSKTLIDHVQGDVAQFKKEYPRIQVDEAKSIKTKDGKTAVVRHFQLAAPPMYEAVAYVEQPTHVLVMVLTSKTRDDFEASLNSFEEIVHSYRYFAKPVEFIYQK
jgi:hypothetical protein